MKKFVCLILSLLLLATVLWGCGSEAMLDSEKAVPMERGDYSEAFYADTTYAIENEVAFEKEVQTTVADNRKLIRRLSLRIETENCTELLAQVENQVRLYGGYIEAMDASTRFSESNRYANLTIRVPADRLDEFAGYVGEVSNIIYRTESSEDITTTYVDTESRRVALQTEYDRLLVLLEQAASLNDILQIETRLTEVRYELERIESQLRTYDNLVDYATITLNITEVQVYTAVEPIEKGFWEEMGDGFMNSLKGVWSVLTGIFSALVIGFPYLLLASVVPVVVLLIIFKPCKKRNKKNPPQNPQ